MRKILFVLLLAAPVAADECITPTSSDERTVICLELEQAEREKVQLLHARRDFNMASTNATIASRTTLKAALEAKRDVAGSKAATKLQARINRITVELTYWEGPGPAVERAKHGPAIAEVSQLIEELQTLLETTP